MNGTKLLDYLDIPDRPTVRVPVISHEAIRLQRLRDRASALGMDFDDYLDMLIARDYLAWLDWQARRVEREAR